MLRPSVSRSGSDMTAHVRRKRNTVNYFRKPSRRFVFCEKTMKSIRASELARDVFMKRFEGKVAATPTQGAYNASKSAFGPARSGRRFHTQGHGMTPATSSIGTSPSSSSSLRADVDYDVLIVGAGLSGVAAAHHLRERCPSARFAILESRSTMGGTWDLFRYPGVRSDSDMFTLGYSFRPWHSDKSISDGQTILDYIRDTAQASGIDKTIKFAHKVTGANWDSQAACWTVQVQRTEGNVEIETRYTCKFLYMCSGYYDYDEAHAPRWPDMEKFKGRIVHPQHWPADLTYADKRVIVIGSGATAVTLVPAMADTAQHVTMLQRSHLHFFTACTRQIRKHAAQVVAVNARAQAYPQQERAADHVLVQPRATQAGRDQTVAHQGSRQAARTRVRRR